MILIFTDFGQDGPYRGEMRAVLGRDAPEVAAVELMADAPACRPDLAAYLLEALLPTARPGDVVLAIVDPGVGSARRPLALELDGIWFVGPDNGLFEFAMRRARRLRPHEITWRPDRLSASFHGRDLFAPVAARLARGNRLGLRPVEPLRFLERPADLPAIVAIDRYGNGVTGIRAVTLDDGRSLEVDGQPLPRARTFADQPAGQPFWYENSSGLAEIAVNSASAAALLDLAVGQPVGITC